MEMDDDEMEKFIQERHRIFVLKSEDMSDHEPDYERRGTDSLSSRN